jgi:hypothetical protein
MSVFGRTTLNQPPRFAHAEPVAGSSRIAGPLGKKKRASTVPAASPASWKT